MKKIGVTLENERSWGIELISLINSYAEKDEKSLIKFASGEVSLTTNKGSLFPDVLLFGDKIKTKILQGWELKFPNTKIDNKDLIENAEKKARLLGVNSFFIWNVSKARLYVENEKKEFKLLKEWDSLSHITSREEVGKFMHEIKEELYKILKDLNFFFENGILKSEKILTSITSDYLYSSLFRYLNDYSQSLKKACQKDSELNDDISLWWEIEGKTYGEKTNKWNETSKLAITSLINKFIFVNILKKYNKKAKIIEELDENASIEKCLEKFETISKQCDFYNIFEEKLGEKYIDKNSLKNILEFNSYLLNLDFTNYDNSLLEMIMAQVVTRNTRKVSGQFATPRELAIFLSTLTLQDKTSRVLDPCCGTGTILKAVYDLKKYYGINIQENLKNIWAGDKFRYPLQFAMLALTNPENIGVQINIFKSDIFDLEENKNIQLHDVNSKNILEVKCGKYEVIISNLPFVQQESLKNKDIYKKINLDNKRSDLYAYILLKLEELLAKNGKIGVIISNSWLGTEFGDKFYNRLIEKYNIEYIVTSGKGRWFKNADVVTNLVILSNNKVNNNIRFVTLNKKIEELIGNENTDNQCENASNLVAKIRKNIITKEFIQNNYTEKEIENLMKLGMIRNSLFTNCKWLLNLETFLIPITKYFEIKRGERRGCNELFYPKNHTIEREYISPVIKNLKKSSYLINSEDFIDGFTCSKSQEELKKLGHINALEWIKKFDGLRDNSGKIYNEKLKKKGYYWYEMTLNNLYDIALLVNPNERLFFSKVMTPVFFDQRLIGLTRKDKTENLDLLIALLNSVLGIFYIEAIGFGRGLGVLDLSKDKFEGNFKMLNPELISEKNKNKILEAYKSLEKREIKKLILELNEVDRIKFDKIVLEAFGLGNYYEVIKNSLLELFKIRMSATEK